MLILRPTVTGDLTHVAEWEAEADTSAWLGETGAAWHGHALADADQEHLVAVDGEAVVGFAVLAGLRGSEGVEIRRMVVAPAQRGMGRGRAVLQAVVTRAYRKHSAHLVWLDVKAHNRRARDLYISEGFVPIKTQRNTVPETDGTFSDLIVMAHRPADDL